MHFGYEQHKKVASMVLQYILNRLIHIHVHKYVLVFGTLYSDLYKVRWEIGEYLL